MRLAATALVFALALAPGAGLAHGELPAAMHGGMVQEAGEMYLELVVQSSDVTVWVLSENRKPVPAAQISGTATVLVDGKSYKVELTAAEANSVRGKLPVEVKGRVVATVAVKVGGKTASARFMPAA